MCLRQKIALKSEQRRNLDMCAFLLVNHYYYHNHDDYDHHYTNDIYAIFTFTRKYILRFNRGFEAFITLKYTRTN